jgi:hypothetical protein
MQDELRLMLRMRNKGPSARAKCVMISAIEEA